MCALFLFHVKEPEQPQNCHYFQECHETAHVPEGTTCRFQASIHSPRSPSLGGTVSHGPGHGGAGLGELRAQKSALEHRRGGILARTLASGLPAWLCLGSSTHPRGAGQGGSKACWRWFPAGPEARTQKPLTYPLHMGFPGGSDSKESTCSVGEEGSIPGLGTSPGGGNGYTLQYSCLENPMDRGAWQAIVHGVTKNQT